MLKFQDLKKQTPDELKALYRDLSKEIFEMKTLSSIERKVEKPHLMRQKKKDRARVMTALKAGNK
jgi:large subunit ribosomal protein L29